MAVIPKALPDGFENSPHLIEKYEPLRRRKPVDDSKLDEVAMVDEEGREWTHRMLLDRLANMNVEVRETTMRIKLLAEQIQHEQVRRFEGHS